MLSAAGELIPNAFQDSDATDTEMSTRQQRTALLDTGAVGAILAALHSARPWPPPARCTQLGSRGGCCEQQPGATATPGLWSHQSHAHAEANAEGPAGASRCRARTQGSNFAALPWGGPSPARPCPLSAGSQGAQKQLHELIEPGERGDSQPRSRTGGRIVLTPQCLCSTGW